METRRRPAPPAQTPETPSSNQGRKKPRADTDATAVATVVADTDATPKRAFFDSADCNTVTAKRLGGRTVIFSPTVVGAIVAHAGFALDKEEYETFALLAQVLYRGLKTTKPIDLALADHFGVSLNIIGSKSQSKVIGRGSIKFDLIVHNKGYLVVTIAVQTGDYNLTHLLTELERFYLLNEEEDNGVELVKIIQAPAPTYTESFVGAPSGLNNAPSHFQEAMESVPTFDQIPPLIAQTPTVPAPTLPIPTLSSMVAPSVPWEQLQQLFTIFQNNQSPQRTVNMVAKTQPKFQISLPGFAVFKQEVMQFGLYPGCLFDFLTPNDRTTLALTFSEMTANQAIPYVEDLLKKADAANSLKIIEEQLHKASFSVALNGLKIKVGDSPMGGPDEVAWRQAMVSALTSCTGLSNYAKNTVIMAAVEEDYKSTVSHWKAMHSETWKYMDSLDLVSQLSQQLAIVRNAAFLLQGDKKFFLKSNGNSRANQNDNNNNDIAYGLHNNNNNHNNSGNNNNNAYSNNNNNSIGRVGQGANNGFRGRGANNYPTSKLSAATVSFADRSTDNSEGEELEAAALKKNSALKKRAVEETKATPLLEPPEPLTDVWCLTNNYCKICRSVGHYYFGCKNFDLSKCAKNPGRRDEIGKEYDAWKAAQSLSSSTSSKKKK